MINDKYHIQYDFMCLVRLSYQWQASRRADPKIVLTGDLNFIGTDRRLNTGIIERFCFLM